jgi:hypothetical protein
MNDTNFEECCNESSGVALYQLIVGSTTLRTDLDIGARNPVTWVQFNFSVVFLYIDNFLRQK